MSDDTNNSDGLSNASAPAKALRLSRRTTEKPLKPRLSHGLERDKQSLYRELLRGLYDAVLVSNLDGEIVDSNRRAQEFFQYDHLQIQKVRIGDIIIGLDDAILEQIHKNMDEGRFTVLDAHCMRRNETAFPAEIAIGRVKLTPAGNLIFSVRNIEWRKKAEEMLKTEHNALQNAASCIAITDEACAIQYVNPAFASLWEADSPEDMTGRDVRSLWRGVPVPLELFDTPLQLQTWVGEIEARTSKGQQMFLHASSAPNRDPQDNLIGMVFSFIDITDRVRAEEAIRREAEAQIKKAQQEDDFSGQLNIISISDVLQLIDSTGKSGDLTILDEDEQSLAQMSFRRGQIVMADCNGATGENAVIEAMRQGGVAFLFRQGTPSKTDASITRSIMSLLLEGSQFIDEKR